MGPQTFCIDATNAVRRAYGYAGDAFREQEDANSEYLVAALAEFCQRQGASVEVDVVFDGADRFVGKALPSNLSVRFARETPADELILDRVRSLRHHGGKVTVVTGDGDLGERIGQEGGRWFKIASGAGVESWVKALGRGQR